MLSKHDLVIFPELYSVTIRGYEPKKIFAVDDEGNKHEIMEIDPPGLANWFCDEFGFEYDRDEIDEDSDGILWSDYDESGYDFSVLVTKAGLENLKQFIADQEEEPKYGIVNTSEVDCEQVYGDINGTIVIMKHPDGFVIAE